MRAFVIAMDCEADTVRPFLKPEDRLCVSGIGKVNAAASTMQAICDGADEIWNVGLSGFLVTDFGDDCACHRRDERRLMEARDEHGRIWRFRSMESMRVESLMRLPRF